MMTCHFSHPRRPVSESIGQLMCRRRGVLKHADRILSLKERDGMKRPPAKPIATKKPDGTLRIKREIAENWVPWFTRTVASLGLGPEAGLVRFAAVVKSEWDKIGDKKGIAFPMSNSFRETITDFHRREMRDSMHPIFYALGAGWSGVAADEPEVPPEELARAKADLAQPYVEVPFKPVEPVAEVKKKGVLFV